jgi:diguanylate cyclase (GGDEF)-like protein
LRPDRILVVDDDAGVRDHLVATLANQGFEVTSAENGAEALTLLESARPDLVLSDIHMPKLNGFDLLAHIRQACPEPDLPVILLSGSGDCSVKVAAIDRGANDYVVKPVESGELSARIRARLRESQLLSRLREQAMIDELTGAHNRRGTLAALEQELVRAVRTQTPVSVLLVDIDDFKHINDSCGHLVGDRVLCEVTSVMMSTVRASDVVGRVGGDEFLVILPDVDDETARGVAERLRNEIGVSSLTEGLPRVSVSIGVASGWAPDTSSESLVETADRTMYAQKRAQKA